MTLFVWVTLIAGKMFKSAELPWIITFLQMFYNDKPVDWLLDCLIYTRACTGDKDAVTINYSLILSI